MTHTIPSGVANSTVEHYIDEYVRLVRDREILKEHWFGGLSLMAIAEKHDISLTAAKSVVYGVGDKILTQISQS